MSDAKKLTVEDVRELFADTVTDTFAATAEGQAHLNRIAKAITNESLDKRKVSMRHNSAEAAYRKELDKVSSKTPEKVADFVARKATWISNYIDRKYGADEE